MTISNLCERQHFDTLNTLKNVQIQILGHFENLSFSRGSIVEHFNQGRDNLVTMTDISKRITFLLMIPNLGERLHFDTRNTFKKVQILISGCFEKLSFIHGSIVELYKQERGSLTTIKDISK